LFTSVGCDEHEQRLFEVFYGGFGLLGDEAKRTKPQAVVSNARKNDERQAFLCSLREHKGKACFKRASLRMI